MNKEYPVIDIVKTGKNIKDIMFGKGYTVKEVQSFLGLGSAQSIYHWLEGKSMPSLDNLYALSELFRVPMDMLIKGSRKSFYNPLELEINNRLLFYYEQIQMRAS